MAKRFLLVLFLILVALDWISKYLMIELLSYQGNSIHIIGNFFKLYLLYNTGFSFSLGADYPTVMRFIWGPGAIIVSLVFLYFALKITPYTAITCQNISKNTHNSNNNTETTNSVSPASNFDTIVNTIAFLCLAAGGFANAFERLIFGRVTDFLSFTFFNKYSFAVFNVADIYVSIGAVCLIFLLIKGFFSKSS